MILLGKGIERSRILSIWDVNRVNTRVFAVVRWFLWRPIIMKAEKPVYER